MEPRIPDGTTIILDRSAIPVSKKKIYDTGHKSNVIEATIVSSTEWGNDEYRYTIRIGEGRTIFPIERNKFELPEK